MEVQHLSPSELADAILDYNTRWPHGSAGLPPISPVFEWERRIEEEPETAWQVFQEIVRRHPVGDDTLEQVWYRLEQLLSLHWNAFHERIGVLVRNSPGLARVAPKHGLEAERYEPRSHEIGEVVAAYLVNIAVLDYNVNFRLALRNDPDTGLALAIALIERAPAVGLLTTDVVHPLQDVLRYHGPAVIDRVEAASAVSGRIRRALWRMQRHERGLPAHLRIPEATWIRAREAAGGTTDYTSDADLSSADLQPLAPELETLLAGWTTYWQSFWANGILYEWIENNPDAAWDAIVRVVAEAPDDSLGFVGAGPLEDLLRQHAAAFIDRAERQAATDNRFRIALGEVWQVGMPDDIWQRVRVAVGK